MGSAIKAARVIEFPEGAPKDMKIGEVRKKLAMRMKEFGIQSVSNKTFVRHGITKDKIPRKN